VSIAHNALHVILLAKLIIKPDCRLAASFEIGGQQLDSEKAVAYDAIVCIRKSKATFQRQ
jgi:hypothetical protein